MVLPRLIVSSLVLGTFRHVMFTRRQFHRHDSSFQLFESWPPPVARGTRRKLVLFTPEPIDNPMHGLEALRSDLVEWESLLLSNVGDSDARATLEGKVTQHLRFLHNFKAALSSDAQTSLSRYPTFQLIEGLRACWLLRSSDKLKLISHRLVNLYCPPVLQSHVHEMIDRVGTVPHRSTISRARVALDLGYAYCMRDVFCPEKGPSPTWWLWADSSPMGGTDWLITYLHYCRCVTDAEWLELVMVFHELCMRKANGTTVDRDPMNGEIGESEVEGSDVDEAPDKTVVPKQLTTSTLKLDDGDFDFDEDVHTTIAPALPSKMSVRDLTKVVCRSMAAHTLIPQGLGTRAASLPHKASCVAGSLRYECTKADNLEQFMKAGVSGTFDLGTRQHIHTYIVLSNTQA